MVMDSSGALYSTTAFGGANGLGTMYKIDKKKNQTVLHSFTGGSDGQDPNASVVLGSFGTAFKETPAGAFSVFYQFQGGTHASFPGPLIVTPNAFYGPASGGAPFNAGVIYRLDQSGETDLYRFVGGADGSSGRALVRDNAGNLYGTGGGGDLACRAPQGCGVVFTPQPPAGRRIHGRFLSSLPDGQLITIYTFTGGADGGQPNGVIRDAAGNLYGTTYTGGIVNSQCFNFGCGVVFQLSPTATGTWKETVLHSFNGTDGDNPIASLQLDPSQPALYGTTSRGGDYSCTTLNGGTSCGVVFKITP